MGLNTTHRRVKNYNHLAENPLALDKAEAVRVLDSLGA